MRAKVMALELAYVNEAYRNGEISHATLVELLHRTRARLRDSAPNDLLAVVDELLVTASLPS